MSSEILARADGLHLNAFLVHACVGIYMHKSKNQREVEMQVEVIRNGLYIIND